MEEREKELEKQKEMKSMYKMRLERTQNYLRYCLQVAQDNGFLELIINNKEKQQESINSSTTIIHATSSPQTPPQQQPHSDITYLIHQAKLNGWYIEPHEVRIVITIVCLLLRLARSFFAEILFCSHS